VTNGNGNDTGSALRAARNAVGLTRAQLAGLTGCSISSLGLIEQGAVPKRSAVLERAWTVIDQAKNEIDPAGNRVDQKLSDHRYAQSELYTVE
jgi:transcriptional regulator with XRE-family HTH domain